jgi:hypothetical protein
MAALDENLTYALAAALIVAALASLVWSRRLAAAVGPVRYCERPRRRLRLVFLVGALAAGGLVTSGGHGVPLAPALLALAMVAVLALLTPGFRDSVYGERGVRYGWYARRYEQLEEWRLTGEHLRWKLYGEWVSSRVPTAEHPELRTKLERLAPGRESGFAA